MPRANRPTPTGQMSLFQVHQDAKRQNNRWIVSGTATVGQLLAATEREPEEHYGIQMRLGTLPSGGADRGNRPLKRRSNGHYTLATASTWPVTSKQRVTG